MARPDDRLRRNPPVQCRYYALASSRNCPGRGPARLVAHDDIYFVVQSVQTPNQTIDREFAYAAGDKSRNVRLLEPKHGSSLGLSKLPTFDNSTDFANK